LLANYKPKDTPHTKSRETVIQLTLESPHEVYLVYAFGTISS
jgi:hypothetical protein